MLLCILFAAFIDLVCQNTHLFWVYDLMIFSPFVARPSPFEMVPIVLATCCLLPPVLPLVDTSHKGKDVTWICEFGFSHRDWSVGDNMSPGSLWG